MEKQSKGKDLYWKPTKVPNLTLLLFCWKPFKILFSRWSSNSITKLPSINTFTICCLNFYDIFSHFTFQLYPTTCISCKNALFPSRPVYKLFLSLSFYFSWPGTSSFRLPFGNYLLQKTLVVSTMRLSDCPSMCSLQIYHTLSRFLY